MLPALANHLWQSTLFAIIAGLVAFSLRRYSAQVRHGVLLAASLKFLAPFALLVGLGSYLPNGSPVSLPAPAETAREMGRPFAEPVFASNLPAAVRDPESILPGALLALWLAGSAAILAVWMLRWLRIRAMVRRAEPSAVQAPIPVLSSHSRMEPGVFGIFRPVLLLPHAIEDRLPAAQLRAIIDHELAHVRRRDNLAAALQMFVEALFWFHPLVWWIGARLVEERERACDEAVLRTGSTPEEYAEGILNVCRYYLQSPLPCMSGITGSDLKRRIEGILTAGVAPGLTLGRKLLLGSAAFLSIALPLFLGLWTAPLSIAQDLVFEVASVKPAAPNQQDRGFVIQPGDKLRAYNMSLLRLMMTAYGVEQFQITGGPEWIRSLAWDIQASPSQARPGDFAQLSKREREIRAAEMNQRVRNLLADRFRLVVRRETREAQVYALVPARSGPRLKTADHDNQQHLNVSAGGFTGRGATIGMIARVLSQILRRPVHDETGLRGSYDFTLQWTPDGFTGGQDAPSSPVDGAAPSLYAALQEQLGLRLEPRKGSIEFVVVERAEKPAGN